MNGLRLMAEHRIAEGLTAAVAFLRNQKQHGSERRTKEVVDLIVKHYGGHAKAYIPEMERIVQYFEEEEQFFPAHLTEQKVADVRAGIQQIRDAEEPSDALVRMAEWHP